MGKLKIKRKGFGFELVIEGEIELDNSKIKPYEEYIKEQTNLQVKDQLTKYLKQIANFKQYEECSFTGFSERMGAEAMIDRLSDYLVKNLEN